MIRDAFIVVAFVVFGHMLPVGCAGAVKQVETVSDPKDDARLSECRTEGRASKQLGDAPEESYRIYDACMRDAGFR